MIRLEYLGADAGFGLLTGILLPHPTITTAININKVVFMAPTLPTPRLIEEGFLRGS